MKSRMKRHRFSVWFGIELMVPHTHTLPQCHGFVMHAAFKMTEEMNDPNRVCYPIANVVLVLRTYIYYIRESVSVICKEQRMNHEPIIYSQIILCVCRCCSPLSQFVPAPLCVCMCVCVCWRFFCVCFCKTLCSKFNTKTFYMYECVIWIFERAYCRHKRDSKNGMSMFWDGFSCRKIVALCIFLFCILYFI